MTARSDPGAIRTILIAAGELPTDDPSRAVRGEGVEVAPDGSIIADYPGLAWRVDPGSLEASEGQLATRPRACLASRHTRRLPKVSLAGVVLATFVSRSSAGRP